jgi:hypothetical protein
MPLQSKRKGRNPAGRGFDPHQGRNQFAFLLAWRFSRWRFSLASSLRIASVGTVSILRPAMSKRSPGVPLSGDFTGGGVLTPSR